MANFHERNIILTNVEVDGYLLFFILAMIVMKFNHDDGDHDHSIHLNKFECLSRIESCLTV